MNDEFEQKLSRQPPRKIPGEWRGEILAAARAAVSRPSTLASRRNWLSTLNAQLSTIFWPHPKAWAGLAAIWIFIFAINFSIRDKTPAVAEKFSPPPPEVMAELKQQKLMFAQLIGADDLHAAVRQKNFSPKPRSEYAEILAA